MTDAEPTAGVRWRRRLPRGSAGAGALEYLGVLGGIAALVAAVAVVPVAEPARVGVTTAICNLLGGQDCGGSEQAAERPLPSCVTSSRDRTIGASGTVASVRLGRSDTVSEIELGDGGGRLILKDTGELGLEASFGAKLDIGDIAKQLEAKGYGELGITGSGSYALVYEFDDVQDMRDFADDRRGVLQQAANYLGGPVADGIEQGVDWFGRWTGWYGEDTPAPSAIAFDVGAQGSGGGGFGASTLAGAGGELQAGVKGTVEMKLDGSGSSFSGEISAAGEADGALALLTAEAGITGKAGYTVEMDGEGRPVSLVLEGEAAPSWSFGKNNDGLPIPSPDSRVSADGSGGAGTAYTRSFTLDLTNPDNRAAFDQAFVTAGPVAAPRIPRSLAPGTYLPDPADSVRLYGPLVDRLAQDAVYVQAEYAGTQFGGSIGAEGGGGLKFGLTLTGGGQERELVEALSRDFSVPGSQLAPLSSCGG